MRICGFIFALLTSFSVSSFSSRLAEFAAHVAVPQGKSLSLMLVATCDDCSPRMQVLSDPQFVDGSLAKNIQLKFNADGLNIIQQRNVSAISIVAHNQTARDGAEVSGSTIDPNAVLTKIVNYTKAKTGTYNISPAIPEEMIRQGLLTKEEADAYAKLMNQPPRGLVIVARVAGKVNQTITTTIWTAKSKVLVNTADNNISLRFPEDFNVPLVTTSQSERPDYQLAISNMREAERLGCQKIYPKEFFSEAFLRTLAKDKVMSLIEKSGHMVTKLKNQPPTQATLTTVLVDSLCEYKDLAAILVKAAIAVVGAIFTGGSTVTLLEDLAQNGKNLAVEIKKLVR